MFIAIQFKRCFSSGREWANGNVYWNVYFFFVLTNLGQLKNIPLYSMRAWKGIKKCKREHRISPHISWSPPYTTTYKESFIVSVKLTIWGCMNTGSQYNNPVPFTVFHLPPLHSESSMVAHTEGLAHWEECQPPISNTLKHQETSYNQLALPVRYSVSRRLRKCN